MRGLQGRKGVQLAALLEGCSLPEAGRPRPPPFLLRALAECAWACVSAARVRAGSRSVGLEAAERRLAVLGPAALEGLRADLAAAIESMPED